MSALCGAVVSGGVVSGRAVRGACGRWRRALAPQAEVQDAHGLETDAAGNIYLEYRNWNNGIDSNGTDRNCLIRSVITLFPSKSPRFLPLV
jgi:hypothetical protein